MSAFFVAIVVLPLSFPPRRRRSPCDVSALITCKPFRSRLRASLTAPNLSSRSLVYLFRNLTRRNLRNHDRAPDGVSRSLLSLRSSWHSCSIDATGECEPAHTLPLTTTPFGEYTQQTFATYAALCRTVGVNY